MLKYKCIVTMYYTCTGIRQRANSSKVFKFVLFYINVSLRMITFTYKQLALLFYI